MTDIPPEFQVGPESLRKYIIAIKDISLPPGEKSERYKAPWPDEYREVLAAARSGYDAGRVEMIQGRDGPIVIQYAIPVRDITGRPFVKRKRAWFTPDH